MKTCYYELLGVESTATEHELKKAYRKKALQLHPDKNRDNIEEATSKFAIVRAAYEVLSDPQERAWYDSHKNSILRDDDDIVDDGDNDIIIPSISVDEILRYFNPSLYTRIDDTQQGFYSVVEKLFERLAAEEVTHGKAQSLSDFQKYKDDDINNVAATDSEFLLYPRFGNRKADYGSQTRLFYNHWSNFLSVKLFNWKDEYRYSMAPDRRTRRLMERENKKLRDAARKEFNETIRNFVLFIKKRDPRVKNGVEQYEKEKKRKQQQELQDQVAEMKKQQKLKNLMEAKNGYVAQDWQQLSIDELEELQQMLNDEYDISTDSSESESEFHDVETDDGFLHGFECIICNKFFKNKNQFETHESSNKHKKAVKKLKWEMYKEGIELGIDKDDVDLEDFETASSEFDSEEDEEVPVEQAEVMENENDDVVEDFPEDENDLVESPEQKNEKLNPTMAQPDTNYEVDDVISEDEMLLKTATPIQKQLKTEDVDQDLVKLVNGIKIDDSDDDWSIPNKKNDKKNKKKKKNAGKSNTPTETATASTNKKSKKKK